MGGLIQLVAYGSQDVYLTGNPQITFFKVVYRRHTNFAIEAIEQSFAAPADFGARVSATVSRNGDLIHKMYLEVTLPALDTNDATLGASVMPDWVGYSNGVGHALMSSVECEIGGQRIDKQYSDFAECWDELTTPSEKVDRYREEMVYKFNTDLSLQDNAVAADAANPADGPTLYIPLNFWFCRNPGLALPLIALQYHEVKVTIDFETLQNLVVCGKADSEVTVNRGTLTAAGSAKRLRSCKLYGDYIFLDTDERRRFAQVSHEYLIEQVQFTGSTSVSESSQRVKMSFSHPVKELIWVIEQDSDKNANRHFKYAVEIDEAKIQLNGHDRISERKGKYFRLVQPYQHHTRMPAKNIYCYSFALTPEDQQPSGSCNFSRIDSAELIFTAKQLSAAAPGKLKVFAISYNVLRLQSGMAGLAYSN